MCHCYFYLIIYLLVWIIQYVFIYAIQLVYLDEFMKRLWGEEMNRSHRQDRRMSFMLAFISSWLPVFGFLIPFFVFGGWKRKLVWK